MKRESPDGLMRRVIKPAVGAAGIFLAVAAGVATQAQVSLEDISKQRPESGSAASMPGCALLASRKVLNDLIYRDQMLSNEVSYLLADAQYLYDSLRDYGEGFSTEWDPDTKGGITSKARYDDQKGDVWNLYSGVTILSDEMNAVSDEARKLEKSWWSIRKAIKKELSRGGFGVKASARLDRLKKRLRSLASRLNNIDARVPGKQYGLDYTRSYYLQYINRIAPNEVINLPDPWHWYYRTSETPRPDLEYDFDNSYQEYWDMSHDELHAGVKRKEQ